MPGRALRNAKKTGQGIPHLAVTDPPSAMASADMAAGGLPVVRGQSAMQNLTPQGQQTADKTGAALGALGGPSQIIASDAQRTQETGAALSANAPGHPPVQTDPNLQSHALGQLEGEEKTPDVRKFLADLVRKAPDMKIPGQGALSSRPGESWNEYRVRGLSAVRTLIEKLAAAPGEKIAVPIHSQVLKLVKAWVAEGLPDDLQVDHKVFLKESAPKPGSVEKFAPDQQGNWTLSEFDPAHATDLPGGAIYFVEHGETPQTTAKSGQVSQGQRARAQIIQHVRGGGTGGYNRVRAIAQKAVAAGHLSEPDVEDAIDEALPTGDQAHNLPATDLLAAAGMASQRKLPELLPAIKQRFSPEALQGLPPHAQNAIMAHLSKIGVA